VRETSPAFAFRVNAILRPDGQWRAGSARDGRQSRRLVGQDPLRKRLLASSARDYLRSVRPGIPRAGISGYDRLSAGIPGRDVRGISGSRRPFTSGATAIASPMCGDFTGATGLEPRDLRRDRPVLAVPGWAGIGGNLTRERGFPRIATRGFPGPGGASGDLVRGLRGIAICCLIRKPLMSAFRIRHCVFGPAVRRTGSRGPSSSS
jgi:hypothetical protein